MDDLLPWHAQNNQVSYKNIFSILYDTQSYFHPSWRPVLGLPDNASPRLLNHLLQTWLSTERTEQKQNACDHECASHINGLLRIFDVKHHQTSTLIRCLTRWKDLESVSYLLGAHTHHAALLTQGRLPFLRWHAGSFACVPALRPGYNETRSLVPKACKLVRLNPRCAATAIDSGTETGRDVPLYRMGMAVIIKALGKAHPLLIERLKLLLPSAAAEAFSLPMPVWRGSVSQAVFMVDLAYAHRDKYV